MKKRKRNFRQYTNGNYLHLY